MCESQSHADCFEAAVLQADWLALQEGSAAALRLAAHWGAHSNYLCGSAERSRNQCV